MKFCTFLWKKTATQKIFCIAVMQKCIANCDAIPGKLFPDVQVIIHRFLPYYLSKKTNLHTLTLDTPMH